MRITSIGPASHSSPACGESGAMRLARRGRASALPRPPWSRSFPGAAQYARAAQATPPPCARGTASPGRAPPRCRRQARLCFGIAARPTRLPRGCFHAGLPGVRGTIDARPGATTRARPPAPPVPTRVISSCSSPQDETTGRAPGARGDEHVLDVTTWLHDLPRIGAPPR